MFELRCSIYDRISSGTADFSAISCSSNASSSFLSIPSVKLIILPDLNKYLRIWSASISSVDSLLQRNVVVSFPDEKTCS